MLVTKRKTGLLVLLCLAMCSMLLGQATEKWESCLHGTGIAEDSFSRVADDKFQTAHYAQIANTYRVKNIIKLSIEENELEVFPASFSLEVTVCIKWADESNYVTTEFKTLRVNYDSSALHHDTIVSFYEFYGGHIVTDSIVAVNAVGLSLPMPDIFSLCNTMEIERNYLFACDYTVNAVSADYEVLDDELVVSWATDNDSVTEEDEFDVEWTFYDDSSALAMNYVATSSGLNVSSSFYNNASRVVVRDYHYQIPLLYESGYLVYRIRPVSILPGGQRICGEWTSDVYANNSTYIYHVAGHEDSINWQSSTTFAEEGKRKSVVSYFDGSSKNRQTTTKINTDSMAVVAETIYDFEGRPVVTTLPTPAFDRAIKHFDFYNTNVNGTLTSYNWDDLDSASGCLPTPRVMNNARGSSRYYSANNPLNTNSYHQFIPDAQGYPFSQTQYTNDLTNRIQVSAGPGGEHHMRETAPHVTKYFYGGAEQSELRMMFGNEAGISAHYFKNLVVDPNGQVAVTYADMHGRTIATALAGDTIESGMNRLPNYKDAIVLRDTIIDSTNQIIENNAITGNKTFVVSTAALHKFYYTLAPQQYIIKACDSSEFCFDCVYDLTIRVTDNCGNRNLPGDSAFVHIRNNYNPANDSMYYFDTLCVNESLPIIDSFELYLLVGSYTVSKTLAVHEDAIEYYFDYYYRNDTCIKKFDDFYSEALSQIDVSGCNMTCAGCLAQLGTQAVFVDSFLHKILVQDTSIVLTARDTASAITAFEELKDICDLMCDSFSVCDFKYGLMKSDMTPGGQYAKYVDNDSTRTPDVPDNTSIFSPAATIYPYAPLYQWSALVYRDERGMPDTVYTYSETIQDTIALTPNNLSIAQFLQYWKPSWANALVQHHPEICNYIFCASNSNSHAYDQAMLRIDNYDTAVAYGFLNPMNHPFGISGFDTTSNTDPYFSSTYGAPWRDTMYSRMIAYMRNVDIITDTINLSLWDIAARSVNCYTDYTSCFQCKKQYYWNTFRNLYIGLKKGYVDWGMLTHFVNNCTGGTGVYLNFDTGALAGKTARFELIWQHLPVSLDYTLFGTNQPDSAVILQQVQDSFANNQLSFRCKDYASYWWDQVRGCGFDSAMVINEFVQICDLGTDQEHPYGSSSTPGPGYVTTHGNQSFEDVLHWADSLSNVLMTPDSNNYPSASCTHFLINNPQPYPVTTFYYQHVAMNRPDSCVCGNISRTVAAYYGTGDTTRTLSQYLAQEKQIYVSEEDIQLLYLACNDSVCETLKHPVAVPYQFGCDLVCVNCYQLISTYNDFLEEFPQVYLTPQYSTLMQSYMNSHLHMNLTTVEYMEFMADSCGFTQFPYDTTAGCQVPVANNDNITLPRPCKQYIPVMNNDVNTSDAQLYLISSGTGIVSVSGNQLMYNKPLGGTLNDTVRYSICNACNQCDTAMVVIAFNSDTCNNPPVAVDDYIAICDSETVNFGVVMNDVDIDGDDLYVLSISGSSQVTASLNGSSIEIETFADGNDTLVYVVCDSVWNSCDTGNIFLTVQNCGSDTMPVFFSMHRPTPTAKDKKLVAGVLEELTEFNRRRKTVRQIKKVPVLTPGFVPFAYLQNAPKIDVFTQPLVKHNNWSYKWDITANAPDTGRVLRFLDQTLGSDGKILPASHTDVGTNGHVGFKNIFAPLTGTVRIAKMQLEYQTNKLQYGRKPSTYGLDGKSGLAETEGAVKNALTRYNQQLTRILAQLGKDTTNNFIGGTGFRGGIGETLFTGDANIFTTIPGMDGFDKKKKPRNGGGTITGGFGGPYLSIDPQANWCDSVAAAIADWEIRFPSYSVRSSDNFEDVMLDDLGVDESFGYWYGQVDTCGIDCPDMVNCRSVGTVMYNLNANYPQYADSCMGEILAYYLNVNNASGSTFADYTSDEWPYILECCPMVSYPTTASYPTFCDSVAQIVDFYNSLGDYQFATLTTIETLLADLTNGSWNFDSTLGVMGQCNIAAADVFPCTRIDSMMSQYNVLLPAYTDSAPGFMWLDYYMQSIFSSHTNEEWIAMLDSCSIEHPVLDSSFSRCDSIQGMVDLYNAALSDIGFQGFFSYIDILFGITPYYSNLPADMAYWREEMDSCGIAYPNLVDCNLLDSLVDEFKEAYPAYADSCPPDMFETYMNGALIWGGYIYVSFAEWQQLFAYCSIDGPVADSTVSLCDKAFAGIDYFTTHYTGYDQNLWRFMDAMAHYLGYANHNYPYYFNLIDSCGLPCPEIVNCSYADSLMTEFFSANPELADTCPPFIWVEYLNENGAGGQLSGGGDLWYTEDAWMYVLNCCDITYPYPDTLHTFCDSVSFAVDNFSDTYPGFGLPGILQVLQPMFDGYYTGPEEDAPLSFWTGLMDSCGYDCGDYVPCTILDSVLSDFYDTYPQYADSCPPWVIETYLNAHIINSLENGANYANWITLYSCCSQTLPDPDSVMSHCDSMFVAQFYFQHIDSLFTTNLGIPCTPAWAYNLYMQMSYGINITVGQLCDSTLGCGFGCPDTCILSTFCDSLVSVYTIMTAMQEYMESLGVENTPDEEDIVNLVMGTSYSEAEMYVALATCDTNFCDPIDGLMGYVGPLFESYDTCMPVNSFLGAMAGVTGIRLDYGAWCNLLSNCGYPCPDTCNLPYDTHCDSVRQAYELYQHIYASLGGGDTVSLMEGVVTAFFGYPLTADEFLPMLDDCDTTGTCGRWLEVYENTSPLFAVYDSCIPAWAVAAIYNSNFGPGSILTYDGICEKLTFCHLPCPDTCAVGPTPCDSILSVYTLYTNVMDLYGVYIGADSLLLLESFYEQLTGARFTDYNTFMLMVALCKCPETTPTMYALNYAIAVIMGDGCAPRWFIEYYYNAVLDTTLTYAQICAMNNTCGLSCPAVCDSSVTYCDSLQQVYWVMEAFLNFGTTSDLLDSLIEYVSPIYLGDTIYSYANLGHQADSCNVIPMCAGADTIQHYIRLYLATNPEVLYQTQLAFEDGLYDYLNDVFNIHAYYVNWCDSLVACNDSCPTVIPSPYLCGRPLLPPVSGHEEDSCLTIEEEYAYITAAAAYKDYIINVHANFVNQYLEKCLGAYRYEHFDYLHPNGEYHFTLYYYDQAGNLVKTIPPNGVDLDSQQHTFATVYRYNTLNQPVEEHTPDAGNTYRWYDRIGKPVFSQNAQQLLDGQFSYTLYDNLQRIIEVGRMDVLGGLGLSYGFWDTTVLSGQNVWYPSMVASYSPKEVTRTYYDEDSLGMGYHFGTAGQQNLRNRVASAIYMDVDDDIDSTYQAASHYSYDVHGNVKTLLQENQQLKAIAQHFKKVEYQYDLISGKVNTVLYQRGQPDQFIHKYEYDGDNRIADVLTSRDSTVFTKDAHYHYYLHGPLARTTLGEHQVQGVDYAYTIQGWLKLINSSALKTARDMGHDGVGAYTATDAYGFSIGYFNNDYRAINNTLTLFTYPETAPNTLGQHSLYNGNIAHTMYSNKALGDSTMARTYRYDQLNRLIKATTATNISPNTGIWTYSNDYYEQLSYDPNGNILTNLRNGQAGNNDMDNMEYHYTANTNRLTHVTDAVSSANYSVDIDNQSPDNYQYDAIGNLTKDVAEGIDTIVWTVYGKIKLIAKQSGDSLRFAYDATGNRVMKEHYNNTTGLRTFTYYQRDATGNIMATYQYRLDTLTLDEIPLYGSSRLGTISPAFRVYPALVEDTNDAQLTDVNYFATNFKQYELTNHLGNVLSTISDRKLPVYVSSTFNHYEPEVVTAQDYHTFGMLMPGRQFSIGSYRYGFNGKEEDDEVNGTGNSLDFGARIYDPRLGRLLSIDPLSKKFASESNYSFAGNSPLLFVDEEGQKKTIYIYVIDVSGEVTKHTLINEREVAWKFYEGHDDGAKLYTADITQTVIIDMKNHSMQIGEEQFTPSEQSWLNQKVQDVGDGFGLTDGKQNFGFNVYSSEGVNSLLFEALKGKADIVESLDISGMVIPSLPGRDIGEALEKLGEVNKDVKVVADIFSKSTEFAAKTTETVEKGVEVGKGEGPNNVLKTTPDSTTCPGCQEKQSKEHIDAIGGEGAFEILKSIESKPKN